MDTGRSTLPTMLRLEDVRMYGNLELIARKVVEGFYTGLHKSPFHGFSVEFAEHRLYNPGSDVRHMDWKVFARTDRLYVKRFEEETNLRCQLVIDASPSMYFPSPDHNKLLFAVYASAAIMHILRGQRDAAGLSVFSDNLDLHLQARSSPAHRHRLTESLETLRSSGHTPKKSAVAQSLHRIAEAIHRRSLVVIFSDMLDNQGEAEEIFSALRHLVYNRHEVLLFHVTDKDKELEFSYDNRPFLFVDMETGERVRLRPGDVREAYVAKTKSFLKELSLRCARYRIDLIEADINRPFSQILLPYLVKRQKMF